MKRALENSGQKELQRVSRPTSSSEQGQLQSVAWGLLQLIFEYSSKREVPPPPWAAPQVFNHCHGNFISKSSQNPQPMCNHHLLLTPCSSKMTLALLSPWSHIRRQKITAEFPFCLLFSRLNTTSSYVTLSRGFHRTPT